MKSLPPTNAKGGDGIVTKMATIQRLEAEPNAMRDLKETHTQEEVMQPTGMLPGEDKVAAEKLDRKEQSDQKMVEDIKLLLETVNSIYAKRDVPENPPSSTKSGGRYLPFRFTEYQREEIRVGAFLEEKLSVVVLVDEKGFGKVAETIAIMACNKMDGTTLIVCPSVAITVWEEEIPKFLNLPDDALLVYRGQKDIGSDKLRSKKIVLTTYQYIRQQHDEMVDVGRRYKARREMPWVDTDLTRPNCPLFAVDWARVVLEEGHAIRCRSPKTIEAVCRLVAKCRYIICGTMFSNEYHSRQHDGAGESDRGEQSGKLDRFNSDDRNHAEEDISIERLDAELNRRKNTDTPQNKDSTDEHSRLPTENSTGYEQHDVWTLQGALEQLMEVLGPTAVKELLDWFLGCNWQDALARLDLLDDETDLEVTTKEQNGQKRVERKEQPNQQL